MIRTGEAPKKRVGRNVKANYSNVHRLEKKAQKRAEAEIRVANWQKLTPEEQLHHLNKFQPDGAKRQKAKIQAKLSQAGYTTYELLFAVVGMVVIALVAFGAILFMVKAILMD